MAAPHSEQLEIGLLADHPEVIETLARWFTEEWGSNPQHSIGSITALLNQRLNRDQPPMALIGFTNDQVVASASLKIRELEQLPQYEHWLGSVYVRPEKRGLGFGKQITQAAIQQAHNIGIAELYLYTNLNLQDFYAELGWQSIQKIQRNGRSVTIMRHQLSGEM